MKLLLYFIHALVVVVKGKGKLVPFKKKDRNALEVDLAIF